MLKLKINTARDSIRNGETKKKHRWKKEKKCHIDVTICGLNRYVPLWNNNFQEKAAVRTLMAVLSDYRLTELLSNESNTFYRSITFAASLQSDPFIPLLPLCIIVRCHLSGDRHGKKHLCTK